MKRVFIIIAILLINGCEQHMNKDILHTEYNPQTVSKIINAIYKSDNAKKYSKEDIKQASEYNQQGMKFNKEKKYQEAINTYILSLQKFPSAETYYNLGNALLNIHNYQKGVIAYLLALKYMPKHRLYNYNLACAYSLLNDIPQALVYLEKSLECGYNTYDHIWKDPDMENARKSSQFDAIMKKYQATKLTVETVIQEGYCEIDHGYMKERFIFNGNKTFTHKREGNGPYGQMYAQGDNNPDGTWSVIGHVLRYSWNDSPKVSNTLYLKVGHHECSF